MLFSILQITWNQMYVDGRFYSSCFLFGSDQMRGRYSVGNCDTICEELFFLVGITENITEYFLQNWRLKLNSHFWGFDPPAHFPKQVGWKSWPDFTLPQTMRSQLGLTQHSATSSTPPTHGGAVRCLEDGEGVGVFKPFHPPSVLCI